jgi:hypothetical protein
MALIARGQHATHRDNQAIHNIIRGRCGRAATRIQRLEELLAMYVYLSLQCVLSKAPKPHVAVGRPS